jgi:hypothetical protein
MSSAITVRRSDAMVTLRYAQQAGAGWIGGYRVMPVPETSELANSMCLM